MCLFEKCKSTKQNTECTENQSSRHKIFCARTILKNEFAKTCNVIRFKTFTLYALYQWWPDFLDRGPNFKNK